MKLLTNNNLIDTNFVIKTEWDEGFTGRLDLLNIGEKIEDWQIEFESPLEIKPDQIWGAEIVSHQGDRYILEPVYRTQTIDSEQTISISFNANKVNGQIISPTNIIFNNKPASVVKSVSENALESATDVTINDDSVVKSVAIENTVNADTDTAANDNLNGETDVNFTLIKDWESGFKGQISITNTSASNIDSWTLEFDFPNQIDNIWDAEIESNQNGSYVISNTPWNREIKAGETITFSFTGDNSVTSEPQNFTVDGSTFASLSTSDSIYTYSNPDLSPELELNQNYQGRATFYDAANPAGGLGASGYDVPAQSELHKIVAINNVQWNGSEASGAFFEVSGPKQREGAAPIVVQVVDYLYERADGFDMSAEAFAKIAAPIDGIVNIDYQLVGPSDDYVTAYGYSLGQGIVVEGIAETHPYYGAVRLNNFRYPIESVDLLTENKDTIELKRESDNRFVLEGNYPLYGAQDLVVTSIFGQQVTLDDVNITNGSSEDIITAKQFELI